MIRRPPRSTLSSSSAASDVYKRQVSTQSTGDSVSTRMPLKIPDDLTAMVEAVREDGGPRWMVAGYDGSRALKLIASGDGDHNELISAIAAEDQVHYGLINSPNGVVMGYVEWVGEYVNGMKKSYVMRNLQQTTDLWGYAHYTFKAYDKETLQAAMDENGEFTGERTLGEVRGWEPNLQDWESMWNDTNPLDGWDPNSQWVYKWNPYGLLEFGNLPETDLERLRNIYNLSLIHISEPTRLLSISYAVFCLKKKKKKNRKTDADSLKKHKSQKAKMK
eukprot:TRINITY_DN13357_c0_g1_i3.p1 TRINITY_DN13357_c0_g1~~TRINITY_DN13357_c0_g1_i3.p1  ORF type:complete len:276 (+),score=76.80 TRINITY_DN13357_c0_g1_i3:130-957(+)